MNIVYVADIPQKGGASESLFEVVRAMSCDYDVTCAVLFPSNGPLKDRFDGIGVKTVVTGHRGFLVSRPQAAYRVVPKYGVELVRYLSQRRTSVQKAEAAIDFTKVDIVHSNLPRNDLGMILAARHGIPHVCHLREFSFEDFSCWSYQRNPEHYLSEGTDAFIAVSQACGDAWVRRGLDVNKVHVVYNGIDPAKYSSALNAKRTRFDGAVRLLFLGGCNEAKGVNDAVDAVAMLPDGVRERVELDIYGWSSKRYERTVRRRIALLGLEGRARVHGPSEDVAAILSSYDIGLICSRSEAFGRVLVEYQAAGLAVVGADVGSVPELLAGGERGRLYHKEDGAESLAREITRLVTKRSDLLWLQENGPSFARHFSISKTISGCMAVYEELVGKI